MKRLNIAQIVCVFPPHLGGIGHVAANLSYHISNAGHKVTVLTPDYNDGRKPAESNYTVRQIRPLVKFGNAAFLLGIYKHLRKVDLIDLHLPFIGTDIVVYIFALLNPKKKLFIHYHMDLIGKTLLTKLAFPITQNLITPLLIKRANKVIVASADYFNNSKIKGLLAKDNGKLVIMPFGIDANVFYPTEKNTELVKKYNISKKDNVMLFVGGLDTAHYFKGIDRLLPAIAMLKDVNIRLLIIGKGDLMPNYKRQAQKLGIAEKVAFVGFIPNDQLPQYYNLSDIFILPSVNSGEAFGIVLIEAMACRKCVVASNLPGVREVTDFGKIGVLVEPGDTKDLAAKLSTLVKDQCKREEKASLAYEQVKRKYNWPVIVDQLIKLYQ